MMDNMDPGSSHESDEFDEIDVTEDEFDRMMATGEPVAVLTVQPWQPPQRRLYTLHVSQRGAVADPRGRQTVSVQPSGTRLTEDASST